MKIMVLGIRGMPNVQGGVETHAEHLYRELALLGCDVEALVRSPFAHRGQHRFGSVRLRRLWSPSRPGLEAFVHSLLGVIYAGFRRPDVLHIHAIGPAIVAPIARMLGLRVVVTHHGTDYQREKWGRFARWVLRSGERNGMKYAHARIAISANLVNLIQSQYGLDSHLIPNGVKVNSPSRDTNEVRRFGLEPGKYFLHVGRMVPEKRQLDLIRAYSRHPHGWKLALVGSIDSTPYAQQIRALSDTPGLLLTDYLSGESLRQLYSHAGAFILPSSHEGLPIAMLEALSYGLEVLASDIPANLEVGLDSSHYYPLGDLTALSAGLIRLERSSPDEAARRARSLWTASKYDWTRVAKQTLEVYQQVRNDRHEKLPYSSKH
jgi:glycosyltransferase involved in cell wall biosynthesis